MNTIRNIAVVLLFFTSIGGMLAVIGAADKGMLSFGGYLLWGALAFIPMELSIFISKWGED